jgi:hypothetical protein
LSTSAERVVHIIGTGPVGLAYGHRFTSRGHRVVHHSPSGRRFDRLEVRTHGEDGIVESTYVPQYDDGDATGRPPDLQVYAMPEDILRRQVLTGTESSPATAPDSAFLASVYRVEDVDDDVTLVYPIISAEIVGPGRLSVVAGTDVEVYASATATSQTNRRLITVLDDLGLRARIFGRRDRIRVRYVQTAAAYVLLRALHLGLVERGAIDATAVRSVFDELARMAGLEDPVPSYDSPLDPDTTLAILAEQIRRAVDARASEPTLQNIRHLLTTGQPKVVAHLDALVEPWRRHVRSTGTPRTPAQTVIDSVLNL